MKSSADKAWRKVVSVVTAFALAFTMCPASALADEIMGNEKASGGGEQLRYVSLGASNVNGYGMRGYIPAANGYADVDATYDAAALDPSIKANANVLGYTSETPLSYPTLVRDQLGADLDQLAISSMRAEELHILLDNEYYGDSYSEWRFIDKDNPNNTSKWFNIATYLTKGELGLDNLRKDYQQKVSDADVVTVDIGMNNFGVYISYQMTSNYSLDEDLAVIDPQLADEYEKGKAFVADLIDEYAPEYKSMLTDEFVDTLAYALVGFCVNFDAVMERIYELNPDATVVAVSIQNIMDGLYATIPGVDEPLPLGDLFGALVNAANIYIASGSPYADKYLCADVRQDGRVEFFLDDLVAYNGDPTTLPQDVKDCFDIYDGTPGASYNSGFHVKYLLHQFLKSQPGMESMTDEQIASLPIYDNMLNAAYDVVASVLQAAAKSDVVDLGVLKSGEIEGALMTAINAELSSAVQQAAENPEYDYVLPQNFFQNIADQAGVPVETVLAIATLAVRTSIGNSFFGHPNPNGHAEVANAVMAALENGTTGKDVMDAEMESAVAWMLAYAQENYPEMVDAINQAVEYLGSEEFAKLAQEMKALYGKLDGALTDEQKAAVLDQMNALWVKIQNTALKLTSHEYVVDEDSYYVSLGDSSMTAYGLPGYRPGDYNGEAQMSTEAPVQLAKKLFGENYKTQFEQLAKGGLRAEDMLYFLDTSLEADQFFNEYTMVNSKNNREQWNEIYTQAIRKADLITVGIGAGSATTFVAKQIERLQAGKEPYAIDWSTLVSNEEELTELHDAVLRFASVLDGHLPEVMDVPSATLSYVVAESFVYGYASYFKSFPALLDKIHQINPDAHLVVVGYFNPIDDMTIPVTVEDQTVEIPVGECVNALLAASNTLSWGYAVANIENTTFVSAPDAECFLDLEGQMTAADYLNTIFKEPWKTHSTQKGHDYVAEQIYNMLQEDFIEETVSDAKQAYDQLLSFLKKTAKESASADAKWLYEYVKNNPEEVIALVEQYGPSVVKFFQENQEAVLAVFGWLIENYGEDVAEYVMANYEEILCTMVYLVQEYGDEAWELIEIYAEATGLTAEIESQVADLKTQVNYLKAQLKDALAKADAELAAKIEAQIAKIEKKIAQLEVLISQINQCIAEGKAKIDSIVAEVNRVAAEINGYIAQINECIAQIEAAFAELQKQIADLKAQAEDLYKQIQDAIADICTTIANIQAKVDAFLDALEKLPENAEDAYNALLDYLKQLAKDEANKAAQWLYNYVMNNAQAVANMLKAYGEEALAFVQEHIDAILAIVDYLNNHFSEDVVNYLLANSDKLMEAMVYLVENYGDDAWDMILVLIEASGLDDAVNAKVEDATHGTYSMDQDSYYLALGDSNATGVGLDRKQANYAQLLAEALGLSEDQFADLTVDGLRTQDLRAILDADYQMDAYGKANFADLLDQRDLYVSEIAKADLITLSTGSDNLSTFVSDQLLAKVTGKDAAPMDWAIYVGEENVKHVQDILANTNAYFQENGLDAQTAELLTFIVEAYAYGYFGYAFNYTEVVNDILAINPEAQVVLVGLFNPLDNMVVQLPNGEEFAFGEYVNYFVGLTDVQFVTYATTNSNVTYVAVPDTQVFFDEKVDPTTAEYLLELFANDAAELRPNAAGHKYIQEQILKAMTVIKPLADAQVSVRDVVYNAKAQTPAVTVTVDGKELVQGEDFTVEYQNNVQVGTATAVVTGKGAYKGQATAEFAIKHFATVDSFKDFVADAWYLSEEANRGAFDGQKTLYLDYILATGIMNGYKKDSTTDELTGLFGPNDKLKRADVATILFRVANPDNTATTNPADYVDNATNLPDVENGRYYTAAVNWCVEQGIVTGYKGNDKRVGKFVPNGNVTREELATMLYRFCVEYMGVEATAADITGFKDYGKIHEYALDAMAFCNAEKIMAGRIDANGNRTKVDPRGNATRAEAAKMVAVSVRDVAQL